MSGKGESAGEAHLLGVLLARSDALGLVRLDLQCVGLQLCFQRISQLLVSGVCCLCLLCLLFHKH